MASGLALAACTGSPPGPGPDGGDRDGTAPDGGDRDGAAPDGASPGVDVPGTPVPDVPAADAGPTITLSFQQGVAGYAANSSVGISTYGGLGAVGEWNANGATFADGANDWCTGTEIPPQPYAEVWLLHFGALDVPAGARVVEATLSVWAYGNDTNADLFLAGSYLAARWNTSTMASCAGCSDAPVGFRYRDGAANPWAALGAAGVGTDVLADRAFRVPETGFFALGSAPREYTTRLDPAVVQSWLGASNFGLRLIGGVRGVHHGYVQPQRAVTADRPASMHPRLTLRLAR